MSKFMNTTQPPDPAYPDPIPIPPFAETFDPRLRRPEEVFVMLI